MFVITDNITKRPVYILYIHTYIQTHTHLCVYLNYSTLETQRSFHEGLPTRRQKFPAFSINSQSEQTGQLNNTKCLVVRPFCSCHKRCCRTPINFGMIILKYILFYYQGLTGNQFSCQTAVIDIQGMCSWGDKTRSDYVCSDLPSDGRLSRSCTQTPSRRWK
jgi:hypothetical protein